MKKQNEDEPTVEIFGNSIDTNRHGHDGNSVVWGTMLLTAGIMLLLNTLSIVPWGVWDYIWRFWPVLLILGGMHIILGNSLVARLILLALSVVVFGLVCIYALQSVHSELIPYAILPSAVVNTLEIMRRYAL